MLIRPSFEEAAAFAAPGSFRVVPVSCEILSDSRTPLEVLRIRSLFRGTRTGDAILFWDTIRSLTLPVWTAF